MQLTGPEILRRMQKSNKSNPDGRPDIIIEPFCKKCLGSNSYDLHLGNTLKVYKRTLPRGMRPAIEYRGPTAHYDIQDWFYGFVYYLDFLKNPMEYNLINPKFY